VKIDPVNMIGWAIAARLLGVHPGVGAAASIVASNAPQLPGASFVADPLGAYRIASAAAATTWRDATARSQADATARSQADATTGEVIDLDPADWTVR